MAYQRRKRRFDRKKVVLVERTICILILLALLALAGRWIAGQLSKEDSQKKKQTKTQTDNTAQKEDKTEASVDYERIENYTDIEEEVADVFIVLVSICNRLNINLYDAIIKKEEKNIKRQWKLNAGENNEQ